MRLSKSARVLYPYHPLFGKELEVFGGAGGQRDVIYVRLPNSTTRGIPAWMFDEVLCSGIRTAEQPPIDGDALLRLAHLLDCVQESLRIEEDDNHTSFQTQSTSLSTSSRRQYALEDRARALGFKSVVVIDDDLGISGTGSRERPGFARLLAAVCNGEVGGVFALEASRWARNHRDWHHLIDLCVLTETIVVDAEGIYDPRLLNDRMLWGLKGTMSEFEIGILRQRAREAYNQKIQRGEVMCRVAVGYVRSGATGIDI